MLLSEVIKLKALTKSANAVVRVNWLDLPPPTTPYSELKTYCNMPRNINYDRDRVGKGPGVSTK